MNINTQQQLLIDPIIHEHPLRFHEEATEKLKFCSACRLELRGASYICTKCPDRYTQNYDRYVQYHLDPERKFYLHEKCAKLPYEIQHPSHSSHPLNLYTKYPYKGFKICDECGDIPRGFIYLCEECNFMLDVKCAAQTAQENGVSSMQHKGIESSRHHFGHEHDLLIGHCSDPINQVGCNICELPISGQAHFCPGSSCHYIVHESCLRLPEKMQVPFHAGHMMVMRSKDSQKYPNYFFRMSPPRCYACHGFFSSIVGYECEECPLYFLHSTCANSLRRPLMKLESHEHNLYYLGTDCQLLSANYNFPFNCSKCRKNCRGQPFYRCMECNDINFHLECVPLLHIVKSRHHIHPLTLKDSFIEDDSGEYYCDICEEERFAKDHVYYCEECKGLFLAHIECALAKVEYVVSYLDGQEREESRIESEPSSSDNEYDSSVNSESSYDDDEQSVQDKEEEDSSAQES
ncbi:C1-like protein [Corchorus capsularis]|uniref:C1-like protein n=1 Tax=Corchorus capsularis TaxID=210143 RepID=A0A1R3IPI0_COCAP|nr:C1-like protein [Corchorus capsularis]